MAIVYRAPSTAVPSPRCFTSKRIIIICSSSFPSLQRNQIRFGGVSSSSASSLHLESENPIRFLTPPATNYSLSPEKKMKKKKNLSRSVTVASIRSGEPAVVTGDTWDEYVLKSDVPVLVEFWAAWCGPCTMVHREIEEIAKEYVGKINCYKLKVDDDLELAETYNIKGVPVVMMFKNGKKQDSVIGTMPKYIYVKAIEKLLTS